MQADVRPPRPHIPSLNSMPRYFLGHPSPCVEVIESPILLMATKVCENCFCLIYFSCLTIFILFYFAFSSSFASELLFWPLAIIYFFLWANFFCSPASSKSSTMAPRSVVRLENVQRAAQRYCIDFRSRLLSTLILDKTISVSKIQ